MFKTYTTSKKLFLSLGEQEIKIAIGAWVLLCSWFCVVNLPLGKVEHFHLGSFHFVKSPKDHLLKQYWNKKGQIFEWDAYQKDVFFSAGGWEKDINFGAHLTQIFGTSYFNTKYKTKGWYKTLYLQWLNIHQLLMHLSPHLWLTGTC